MSGLDRPGSRPRPPGRRSPRRRPRGCCRRRRPARARSCPARRSAPASVVAVTQSRAGPPSRRVVWSANRCAMSGGTDDGLGHAEHLLPLAGHGERDRGEPVLAGSLASPATSTSTPPSAGTTTGLVNLQPRLHDLGAREPLGHRSGGERHRVHAVRDHAGQPDAPRDVLVLVDRVVVTARRGVPHQVGAGDREDLGLERADSCVRPPGGRGWRWSSRPAPRTRR